MSSKYDNVHNEIKKFNDKEKIRKKKERKKLAGILDDSPNKRINLNKEVKTERRASRCMKGIMDTLWQFAG